MEKPKVKAPIKKTIYEVRGSQSPSNVRYTLAIDPGFRYMGMTLYDWEENKLSFYNYKNPTEVNLMKSKLPEFIASGIKVVQDYDSLVPPDINRGEVEVLMEYLHNGSNNFTEGLSSLITSISHVMLRELGYNRVWFVPTGSFSYLYGRQSATDARKKQELMEILPDYFYTHRQRDKNKVLLTAHIADSFYILTYVHHDKFKDLYKRELRLPKYEVKTL